MRRLLAMSAWPAGRARFFIGSWLVAIDMHDLICSPQSQWMLLISRDIWFVYINGPVGPISYVEHKWSPGPFMLP